MPEEEPTKPQAMPNENPSLDLSMRSELEACHWSQKMTRAKQGRERDVKHTRNDALEALRADYGDATDDDDGDQYEIHHDETFTYENPTRIEEVVEATPLYLNPRRPSGHGNESLGATRIDVDLDENHHVTFGLAIPPREEGARSPRPA